MLAARRYKVRDQVSLAVLRRFQTHGEALPQYIHWSQLNLEKLADKKAAARVVLHDNLLGLDLRDGALANETWEFASRRILDELPLRGLFIFETRFQDSCHEFVLRRKVSESLIELRLCKLKMNQRAVVLLADALRFKTFWQKFTFHFVEVPAPNYLSASILALGDTKQFWSSSHPFSAIEMCCLADFIARTHSLEEIFLEVDLNETAPHLNMRTCIQRLFAERQRHSTIHRFLFPESFQTRYLTCLGLF